MPDRLHPVVAAAASGELPEWAVAGEDRRAHMARVAALLESWCRDLCPGKGRIVTWRAAGFLHDALRDAPPGELAPFLPERFLSLPGSAYHGPAAAARLEGEGVDDLELLDAIRWHTLGSPRFGALGKALVAADALEPGRTHRPAWRRELRERAPDDLTGVVTEIVASRIDYLLRVRSPVHPRTLGFWNSLVNGT